MGANTHHRIKWSAAILLIIVNAVIASAISEQIGKRLNYHIYGSVHYFLLLNSFYFFFDFRFIASHAMWFQFYRLLRQIVNRWQLLFRFVSIEIETKKRKKKRKQTTFVQKLYFLADFRSFFTFFPNERKPANMQLQK